MLRFWDSGRDINYILNIQTGVDEDGPVIARHDTVTSVDFSKQRGQLVVATKEGHLMMWQFNGGWVGWCGDDGCAYVWVYGCEDMSARVHGRVCVCMVGDWCGHMGRFTNVCTIHTIWCVFLVSTQG